MTEAEQFSIKDILVATSIFAACLVVPDWGVPLGFVTAVLAYLFLYDRRRRFARLSMIAVIAFVFRGLLASPTVVMG